MGLPLKCDMIARMGIINTLFMSYKQKLLAGASKGKLFDRPAFSLSPSPS